MKIVVTGALGHIGSSLIRSIRPGDFERVVLLDDMLTQRYVSLFDLPDGVPYDFVEGDVLKDDLEQLFEGADAVVHLAAITNAAASFDNQEQVERVNFEGTARVARACAKVGAGLISLSTTSVYGVSEGVVDEACDESALQPQSPYAASKRKAEKLLVELGRDEGLRYVSLRFGTIYGVSPGMRFHTAINKFVWQACMGLPLTVWKTALDQKRPYLDLRDAVRALRFFLAEPKRLDGEIYNVLTDNTTVGAIVERIRALVPDTKVNLVDSRIMNQLSYTVANEKVQKLGFRFEGNLDTAIAESVKLLRNARVSGR
ncbi:MAG: nucleoside-diphosphate sugar epimerase [Labilithrix sp.]|nr:nucleoside-diphosphate sugar epimerase [Labilithrix sp.]